MAIFEEEEKHDKNEIYKGDDSLGKRALQRVLMRKQLQQMEVELREIMVYQSPPELGALHTEVEEMMKVMGKQQKVLISKQMKIDRANEIRRRKRIEKLWTEIIIGIGALVVCSSVGMMMVFVIEDRIQKYPELGNDWIPKTEKQRRIEAEPKRWVGR